MGVGDGASDQAEMRVESDKLPRNRKTRSNEEVNLATVGESLKRAGEALSKLQADAAVVRNSNFEFGDNVVTVTSNTALANLLCALEDYS